LEAAGLARCTIGSLGEYGVEDEAIDGFVDSMGRHRPPTRPKS
jgi:hypothetical protein